MIELFLKFKDANGAEQRVAVDKARFAIGRHSTNDLAITDGRLSRDHLLIDRFGDVFVVTERGSSNGSTINDTPLTEPTALSENCRLELGGFEIDVEFVSDDPSGLPPSVPPESTKPAPAIPQPSSAAPGLRPGFIPEERPRARAPRA